MSGFYVGQFKTIGICSFPSEVSNLGYRSGTLNVFSCNRIVVALHQVVLALSHEIVVLAVKRRVMRIAQDGAPSVALHLRAYPFASGACTSVTTLRHAGARLEQLAPQFAWTFLRHDATTFVLDSARRTEATFLALGTLALRLETGETG